MTIFVHHEDVIVPPDRQRQEFDGKYLAELKESILKVGLLHAITAEQNGDGWVLRAGECRLRVLRELHAEGKEFLHGTEVCSEGLVPIVEWNTLTPIQRLEIEIDENLKRRDFTWQERDRAFAKLHQLRQAQNPAQTVKDTAVELERRNVEGAQASTVSDALIRTRYLDDPDVAKAKTAKEAMKVIKKKTDLIHQARLAKQFDLTKVPHTLHHGDSLALLPTLPKEAFDVVLTDPPYGIDADDFGSQSDTGHDYKDSRKRWEEIMSVFPEECYRVAKPKAHAYIFCDPRLFSRLEVLMCLAGWHVFSTPLVWFKGNGMVPFPKYGPRRTYECILYAWKGDREVLSIRNDCIVRIPPVRHLKHGAQKPVALYRDLLNRSARPGDTVLDCFGGTGPILVAANLCKLVATYIDESEANFNIATQRAATQEIDDGAEEDDGLEINLE